MSLGIIVSASQEEFPTILPRADGEDQPTFQSSTPISVTLEQYNELIDRLQEVYSPEILSVAQGLDDIENLANNPIFLNATSTTLQDLTDIHNSLSTLTFFASLGESVIRVDGIREDVAKVAKIIGATKTVSQVAVEILALGRIDKDIINISTHMEKIKDIHTDG